MSGFFGPFLWDLKKTDIYLAGSRSRISKSKFKQFDIKMFSYIEKNTKNFIVDIETPTRHENKSQGVLHAKKAALLFVSSFLSYTSYV